MKSWKRIICSLTQYHPWKTKGKHRVCQRCGREENYVRVELSSVITVIGEPIGEIPHGTEMRWREVGHENETVWI